MTDDRPSFDPEAMERAAARLSEWSEKWAIGLQATGEAAQLVADKIAETYEALYARDMLVEVRQPYSCPIERCRWEDDVGSTCPIHLRDLKATTLDARVVGRAAAVVDRVIGTVTIE